MHFIGHICNLKTTLHKFLTSILIFLSISKYFNLLKYFNKLKYLLIDKKINIDVKNLCNVVFKLHI